MKRPLIVLLLLGGVVLALANFTIPTDAAKPFHTPEELAYFAQIPIGPGEYFQPSSSCRGCHGSDSLGQANVDENGMDVNLFDRWQSTMMAFSAKDPLWRAKVSHEILVNPAHATGLQTKCTSCHAPMGHYTAIYHGATSYTIADLVNDSLGLDGVSCAGCHTIGPDAGNTFSGLISYDTTRNIYGPFPGPFTGPMQLYEGYTPVYSPHMDNSAVCASCHTLFTETVDLNGTYTGGTFPEQATYHEYLNSSYPASNVKCQTCHMPQLQDPIIIANGYITSLFARFPFNQHEFAGANHFMLGLIKDNKSSLNIQVPDSLIDSTMAATLRMLQQQSVEFELNSDSITADTAYYHVRIRNKAGHKFPSGYPARRAVLQFVMTDVANDTVFQSGIFDGDFRVTGENPQFEPHHTVISQDHITQIYEFTMGDVNGQFTSVLERAAVILKDNRIPPDGFTTSAPMYDTVQISPDALADPDFNKLNSVEGTGTDIVHFHVPVSGVTGQVSVHARLFYQAVPPKWLDEMFTYSSGPIDTFEVMYQNADKNPIMAASDSLTDVLSATGHIPEEPAMRVYPTVSLNGMVTVDCSESVRIAWIEIFDSKGKAVIRKEVRAQNGNFPVTLPPAPGSYYIRVTIGSTTGYGKVLRL
jgi:hypothetical protein